MFSIEFSPHSPPRQPDAIPGRTRDFDGPPGTELRVIHGRHPGRGAGVSQLWHGVAGAPDRASDQLPLADQFQFAGRLTRPVPVMQNLAELVVWAQKNPEEYCIIFTRDKDHKVLADKGIEGRYKDGWLIFRPVKGLSADFRL